MGHSELQPATERPEHVHHSRHHMRDPSWPEGHDRAGHKSHREGAIPPQGAPPEEQDWHQLRETDRLGSATLLA
eukprot:13648181-Alexandrium_andersonii.AAC.1